MDHTLKNIAVVDDKSQHSNMDGATLKAHTVYTDMEPPQGRNSILSEAPDSFCISK